MCFGFFFSADIPLNLFQQLSCRGLCIKNNNNVSISMSLKWCFFSYSVQRRTSAVSSLPSSSCSPALGSVQSVPFFICCPTLLRTSQASRDPIGPLGPAGDEAVLILSGITVKLVVFSTQTVAAEWGRSDTLTSIRTGQELNAALQPHISQKDSGSAKTLWMYTSCSCKFVDNQ